MPLTTQSTNFLRQVGCPLEPLGSSPGCSASTRYRCYKKQLNVCIIFNNMRKKDFEKIRIRDQKKGVEKQWPSTTSYLDVHSNSSPAGDSCLGRTLNESPSAEVSMPSGSRRGLNSCSSAINCRNVNKDSINGKYDVSHM